MIKCFTSILIQVLAWLLYSVPAIAAGGHGLPVDGVVNKSKHYHYYENYFNRDIELESYDAKKSRENLAKKNLTRIAVINTLKEIQFSSETGKLFVKIELPYNQKIVKRVFLDLRKRNYKIIQHSSKWDNNTPPSLTVTWSDDCYRRSIFNPLRLVAGDITCRK